MLDSQFEVLNALAVEFKRNGLEVSVNRDTICIAREQRDKSSGQVLTMRSAAPVVRVNRKSFFIFAIEQYDANEVLTKYSITLTDEAKTRLHSWDLDTKRGQHRHEYDRGKRLPGHLPHEGRIPEVAAEIIHRIRMH